MTSKKLETRIHIFDFAAALYDQVIGERVRRAKKRAESTPPDIREDFRFEDVLESVVRFISRRSGIRSSDVQEYIVRAGRGGHWEAYTSPVTTKRQSDISRVAQALSAFSESSGMTELLEFIKANNQREGDEMGLSMPVDPSATLAALSMDERAVLTILAGYNAIDEHSTQNSEVIRKQALGGTVQKQATYDMLRRLKKQNLVDSVKGRGVGGYYLTELGQDLAKRIRAQDSEELTAD